MAKITVDVVLNDGEDSTTFGDSFSSNDNVEVRNPMVSNPSLIGVNVEESYFNTFKSDSRIKIAQRADEFPIISTGTPPAFTNMTGKKIVVSSSSWDTTQPGSNFIPAQFYYDTDIIPQPSLALQTAYFYYALKNNSYHSIVNQSNLGVTQFQNNPTLSVKEGYTVRLSPPSNYNVAEVKNITAPSTPATFNITTTAPTFSYYTLSGSDRNGAVGGNNAGVTVYVGDTINFNLSNVSGSHPFYIKTVQGTGTGNQVSTPAATGQGSVGNNTVSWTPNTAGTYYYQCSAHNGMNGTITVQNDPGGYLIDVSDRVSINDGDQTDPTINIEVGDTIAFYNEQVFGSAHPLYIKTAPTTGTGDLVTTGTATAQGGIAVSPYSLYTEWDTSTQQGGTATPPGTYYYQSSNSLAVGGKIIVHAAGSLSNEPIYVCTSAANPIGTQVSNSTPNISNVTNQGTIDANNYLTVTFESGSTGTYYYQSSNNSSYGGIINVTKSDQNTLGVRTGANYLPDTNDNYPGVDYSSQWTGKHVDIVTMEVGGDWAPSNYHVSHPDFDSLTNPGTTRFIPQDWPGLSDTGNLQVSDGTRIMTDHGAGVLSAAAGTICGFAKHANLYQMTSYGSDSFADMYNALATWHNAKSVNPTTGKKNPTIAIGEVQWGTWWNSCYKISEISSIQEYQYINGSWQWVDVVTRPSGGWGQAGSDVTAFVDRAMIPRQIKDPDTNEYHWVIGVPDQSNYAALNTAMNACNSAGIHMINAASNQGQTFVKDGDNKYANERFVIDANATTYSIGYGSGSSWQVTIGKGTVPFGGQRYPWSNYGTHGKSYGIDVAAGQNSEEWSVLDDYTCRGPGVDIVGMGASTYTSYPSSTFGGGFKWGMFSGTSCATPTVVGKAACEIEKYFTYNNEYPTPAQLKEIVCQQKYFYGHRSNDTYQRKHILLSDSFIRSLTPHAGTANNVGTFNWSSLPTPQTGTFSYTHFYGTAGLCQIREGQSINGGITLVELAGTTRQKANLNVKGFDRSQTRGVRPLSGGVYPRPKIGRHNQLPFLK